MWLKLTHVGDFDEKQFVVNMDNVKYFCPSGCGETALIFNWKQSGIDYVKETVDEIYDMLRGDTND